MEHSQEQARPLPFQEPLPEYESLAPLYMWLTCAHISYF